MTNLRDPSLSSPPSVAAQRVLATVLALLCAPLAAVAQQTESPRERVFGKVIDEAGNGIRDAVVVFVTRPIPAMPTGPVERIEVRSRRGGRFDTELVTGRCYTAWAEITTTDGVWLTDVSESVIAGRPVRLTRTHRWARPRVHVRGRDRWPGRELDVRVLTRTETIVEAPLSLDKAGMAEIPPLPGSRGTIMIRAKDGPHVVFHPGIDFTTHEPTAIEIPARLAITCTVVAKATGKPVEGAWVAQLPSMIGPGAFYARVPMRILARTDRSGGCKLELPRKMGRDDRQFVLVGGPALAATYVPVPEADGQAKLRVELEPGSTLVGRVLRADGKPAAGARLFVKTYVLHTEQPTLHAGTLALPVTCGKDGRFEFQGLTRRDDFQLFALRQGLGLPGGMTSPVHWLARHAAATADKTDLGDIDVSKLAALELRVEHADGSPVPAARIRHEHHHLYQSLQHVADSRGRLRMLAPVGEFVVGAFEVRGGVGSLRSTLKPGHQTRVLRLSEPVKITGKALTKTGKPVAGAWIRLWNRPTGPNRLIKQLCFEQQMYQVTSDANGAFTIWAAGIEGGFKLRSGKRMEKSYRLSDEVPFEIEATHREALEIDIELSDPIPIPK